MSKCCEKYLNKVDCEKILREFGFNITKTKVTILAEISKSVTPMSCTDLSKVVPNVNESTLFRNLKQFSDKGIINTVNLNEGYIRYEMVPNGHHHHYIKCNICGNIDSIKLCKLNIFTEQLEDLGYKNISHNLEFFGVCKTCS